MSVFGESTVFIVLAVGVFVFALVAEILSVRYQQTECKFTKEAIDYLKDDGRRNSGQAVVFKREEVEKKLGKLGWDWLKEHLAGSVDSTGTA